MIPIPGLTAAVLAAVMWWGVLPRARWRWECDVVAGCACLALAAWAMFALGFWACSL